MPFILQPLLAEDASRCVDIYFAAFQNAHSLACWPRIPSVRAWWEKMILDELHEAGAHWLKAVSTNREQEIVGFVKWQEPKPGVTPDTQLPDWPEGADRDLCNETFGAWAESHKELMRDRGHWYLEMVATDPKYQAQGAGSLMMKWGLEQADRQGAEAYLEASPEAVSVYEKFGFREAGRTDTFIDNERIKATMYRNLYMIRTATQALNT